MLKDVFLQTGTQALNRRKIALGFLAVVFIVTTLAINSSVQINRIIKGFSHLIEQPIAFSQSLKTINFHITTIERRVQDYIIAGDDSQRDELFRLIRESEVKVFNELDAIELLSQHQLQHQLQHTQHTQHSKVLFSRWLNIRQDIVGLLSEGKLEQAVVEDVAKACADLGKLIDSVRSLKQGSKTEVAQYQQQSQETADNIAIATVVLAVFAIICVVLLMLAVWRTISYTERLRARRHALIDQQILIAVLDKDGRTRDVSSALCHFFGCWREELIHSNAKFFLSESKRDKLLEKNILNQINKGKEWRGEISYTNVNGQTVWAESSIIPSFNEQFEIEGFSNILHDLTSKKLASIDKLTGLLNRRSYDEILSNQISLAVRNKVPISLAILDIDFFKRFNDSYGHPEGDFALRTLSDMLCKAMKRPTDHVFRIGGEEFAILVTGLDQSKIETFLNAIREKVAALQIPNEKSTVSPYLTVSIGAVVLIQGAITEQELYKSADRALYQAKETRNKVLVKSYSGERFY